MVKCQFLKLILTDYLFLFWIQHVGLNAETCPILK